MTAGREPQQQDGRFARFTKARLYQLGERLMEWATTPGFAKAWAGGWEMSHARRLTRWRSEGFRPRSVLDVGANQGDWSEMCDALFKPEWCNLVEPQRDLCEKLREKAKGSRPNWKIFPVALGSRPSQVALHLTDNRAASSLLRPKDGVVPVEWGTKSREDKSVEVARLDDLVASGALRQPDLIKIDVQGFEGEVIAGGKEAIQRAQRIVVEVSLDAIYEGQPLLHDVMKSLEELGFATDDINESCRSWPDGKLWQVDLWMRKRHE
jgi:FkbM family methyltransferase